MTRGLGVRAAALAAGVLIFSILATANAGGYRYGVSDQAFYIPAVLKAETPALFPRDSALIETEARLTIVDSLLASMARVTGLGLPSLFFLLYLVTLVVLAAGAVAFARALGLSWWATSVCLALLTLRHHIADTGANTLEGYMHPRMLAFGLGLLGLAALVRSRPFLAAVAIVLAAIVHPTTAFWFGIVAVVTTTGVRPAWRRAIVALTVAGVVAAVWALTTGPLAGRLVTMDAAWQRVLADRAYLFPARWPWTGWLINFASVAVIIAVYAQRRARRATVAGEGALVAGWMTLVGLFLVSVPLTAIPIALAVQVQATRVFWLLDVAATVALAWWLVDNSGASTRWRRGLVLGTVLAASTIRGVYVIDVETHRPLVEIDLPRTAWTDAMTWLSRQPIDWDVLADPGQAWKYGSTVRVAAGRDTVLDVGKDPAIALYGRDLAMRVADREAALADFDSLTTPGARALAARYGADVLVVDQARAFDLPVLYRNNGFVIYDLR